MCEHHWALRGSNFVSNFEAKAKRRLSNTRHPFTNQHVILRSSFLLIFFLVLPLLFNSVWISIHLRRPNDIEMLYFIVFNIL